MSSVHPTIDPARPPRRVRLAEAVVDEIARRIRDGIHLPGAKLPPETDLQAALGVSRMVVREAISRLSALGLVVTRQGAGTFVRDAAARAGFDLTPADSVPDLAAMIELRMSLETEAAALAAQRRTDADLAEMAAAIAAMDRALCEGGDVVEPDVRFHLAVAGATANPFFVGAYREARVATVAEVLSEHDPRVVVEGHTAPFEALREHRGVHAAILAGDADSARAAMRLHLVATRQRICGR